jgi:hypothetical protein
MLNQPFLGQAQNCGTTNEVTSSPCKAMMDDQEVTQNIDRKNFAKYFSSI